MKFKAFLASLALFLFVFYVSLFVISAYMWGSQIETAKKRSAGEHYLIVSSFNKDLSAITSREGYLDDRSLKSLFEFYTALYEKQDVSLELINADGSVLYGAPLETTGLPSHGSRSLSARTVGSIPYVCVLGEIPETGYYIQYRRNISGSLAQWRNTQNILLITGSVSSVIIAVFLFLLLSGVFRPLYQIDAMSKKIARGDYQNRLPVTGWDELNSLAASFNHMADEISARVTGLADEAEKKQQFIDNFSHELKTPLTSIYANAEYLSRAPVGQEEMIDASENIMAECKRILNVAETLLELSSLRNREIITGLINVNELFESTKASLNHKLDEKDIKLTFKRGIDAIYGEPELIKVLLINLTDNAIKACDAGGVIIWEAGTADGKLFLAVTDNGAGIPQEQIKRVTEAFYQVKKQGKKDGVGLGLSICKQIAICHNAQLTFESNSGAAIPATTVKITFTT